MRTTLRRALAIVVPAALALNAVGPVAAADPGVELVGQGSIPGNGLDKSGLTGELCQASNSDNCVPASIFGGFGSDIDYTGFDDVYVAAPDRGPFDGLTDTPYIDRLDFLHITLDLEGNPANNVATTLLDTRLMRDNRGALLGAAGAFDARFDPEGIRVGPNGTIFVSDEYGPSIVELNRQGKVVHRIPVTADFAIANPSPDGGTLFGIMQNALIQDHALTPSLGRQSVYTRILKVDLATGNTEEYVYPLVAANRGQGVSEILAINDEELLVLERDNLSRLQSPPADPTRKQIWRINLDGATDVSDTILPATGALPAGVQAVSKDLFIDLLDPDYGLFNTIPEKLEGLTWGPDLPDGRHLLYVISDNDLTPTLATRIFAFAIDPEEAAVAAPTHAGPMFAPGQVKKILAGR